MDTDQLRITALIRDIQKAEETELDPDKKVLLHSAAAVIGFYYSNGREITEKSDEFWRKQFKLEPSAP